MATATRKLGLHLRSLLLVAALTFHHVQSFGPVSSPLLTIRGRQQRNSQQESNIHSVTLSSSRLRLSLDDDWADISTLIDTLANKIDYAESIQKSVSKLGVEPVLSPSWITELKATAGNALQLYLQQSLTMQISIVLLPFFTVSAGLLWNLSFPKDNYRQDLEPYPRGNYDPLQAQIFYDNHKFAVLQRALQVLRLSNRFLINILIDKYVWERVAGDEVSTSNRNQQRAQDLLQLVTQLGPTAIKVGQALSVRPDLIPEEYASALSTLQDRVPPFPTGTAKAILQDQLGGEAFGRLQPLSSDPVASASIGQVYRGLLQTDNGQTEVAIKVQRPNVLAEIALDLYLVREFGAPLYQAIFARDGGTDLQALANEWGRGFIAELDYRTEAAKTLKFRQDMKERNLNAVTAPKVLTDVSTEQILITEWIDGERIDKSPPGDIPRLCAVALNAYLVMLLELKSLHCDPHPVSIPFSCHQALTHRVGLQGNLLRTKEGKLVILDFGMTLDIPEDLQYSLLEYVAHLTAEKYDDLPRDLVKLGFLKPNKLEFAERSGALEPLKYFLKQAGQGGGASGVRERIFEEYREKYPGLSDDDLRIEMRAEMKQQMKDIVDRESVATGITIEVEELQKRNRDAFVIPEWFLYTSRAFLTLEGLSLQADPDYSLIKSCFPYVAKRLVEDQDVRAEKALRELVYGASDTVDVERLGDLAKGFTSFTTTTKKVNEEVSVSNGIVIADNKKHVGPLNNAVPSMDTQSLVSLFKESADILLASEGNLVQSLLIGEGVQAVSGNAKDAAFFFISLSKQTRDRLPFGIGQILPPLPFEDRIEPFLMKTPEQMKAQRLLEIISTQFQREDIGRDSVGVTNTDTFKDIDPEEIALIAKEIRENLPRYIPLIQKLGTKFVAELLRSSGADLETVVKELSSSGQNDIEQRLLTSAASQLSTAALEGARGLERTR